MWFINIFKIILGDHQQLRPQTANHIMSKDYKLDISLFERMVNNNIPSYILAEQHRMRPEIAGLVAPIIYPYLRNHPSVENRPHIKGVDKDVFCITHKVQENKVYFLNYNLYYLFNKILILLGLQFIKLYECD